MSVNLIDTMKQYGLSDTDVAKMLGVNKSTVLRWRRGAKMPDEKKDAFALEIDKLRERGTAEVRKAISGAQAIDFKSIRSLYGLTQSELANIAGLSTRQILAWERGENNARPESITKILKALKALDEGADVHAPYESNARPISSTVTEVPLVPFAAAAGTPTDLYEYINAPDVEMFAVRHTPDNPPPAGAVVFDVDGLSMDPEFREGDKVLAAPVVISDYTTMSLSISRHPFWVVVSDRGALVKQITDHDVSKQELTCHSLNPAFPDIKFKLNELYGLYTVIRLVERSY